MKKFHIDPIVVGEKQTRLARFMERLHTAQRGMEALKWFDSYAQDPDAANVLKFDVKVVASATPGAGITQQYVQNAARDFREQILAKAVEAAQRDAATFVEENKRRMVSTDEDLEPL